MGAETFWTTAKGKTVSDAFDSACKEARYENGHGGYTGTIAEKSRFTLLDVDREAKRLIGRADAETSVALKGTDPIAKAKAVASVLIEVGDPRVDDKWGPAGCVPLGKGEWLFFGWASS